MPCVCPISDWADKHIEIGNFKTFQKNGPTSDGYPNPATKKIIFDFSISLFFLTNLRLYD